MANAATLTVDALCVDELADGTCDDLATFKTIEEALVASVDDDTIVLNNDVITAAQLNLKRGMTLNGNGKSLTAAFSKVDNSNNSAIGIQNSDVTIQNITVDGTGGTNLHGVNVYVSTGVTLNSVTITNFRSGLVVNGSTVTATDLTTSGNAWNSVNVDPGTGVTTDSLFTLTSGTLNDSTQIWSDGVKVNAGLPLVTVNADGYTKYKQGGTEDSYLWSNSPLTGKVIVSNVDGNTFYPSLQTALTASLAGDTVSLTENVTGLIAPVVLDRALTFNGNGYTLGFTGLETVVGDADDGLIITAPATVNNLVVDAGLSNPAAWVGTYAVQIYNSSATLNNVTARKGNGGILANNSVVTLTGTITVSDNGFGGIESSRALAELDVADASFVNSSEAYGLPTVWEDGMTGTTVVGYETNFARITKGTQYQYYLDNEAPVITLNGVTEPIRVGRTYTELGATTDDGSTVVITGTVDTAIAGSYIISYDAVDEIGNDATAVTRTVTVVAPSVGSGGSSRRATPAIPAIPAIPGVRPATPAIPAVPAIAGASAYKFAQEFGLGAEGADVTELQKILSSVGVFTGPITGYFGPITQAALRNFQSTNGITATGYVGPLTLAELNQGEAPISEASEQVAAKQLQLIDVLKKLIALLKSAQ